MHSRQRNWGVSAPLPAAQPATAPEHEAPAKPSATARTRQTPSLAGRALQALTRREYSRSELQRKLTPHADSAEQLQTVLDAMQAKGFLSDARAAEAMTRQKSARFGNARIRQELQAKGIEKELINQTLAALEDNEWERAQKIWRSKFGHLSAQDLPWQEAQKLQAKQLRFMLGRGFSSDLVRKLVHESSPE